MSEDDLEDVGWVMWTGTIGLESPVWRESRRPVPPAAGASRSAPLTFFTPNYRHRRSGSRRATPGWTW